MAECTRITKDRTARFWTWGTEGWVKLSLRPGESLEHTEGGPCDEGWSYSSAVWTHHGDHLTLEASNCSQDCDGRLDRSTVLVATELREYTHREWQNVAADEYTDTLVGLRPDWHEESYDQRDHSAEAMGY
jgi:hypothetical protein